MKNDCLFCAIIDGEIPSNKVYEDEQCYAFYDIEPQAPTHLATICCVTPRCPASSRWVRPFALRRLRRISENIPYPPFLWMPCGVGRPTAPVSSPAFCGPCRERAAPALLQRPRVRLPLRQPRDRFFLFIVQLCVVVVKVFGCVFHKKVVFQLLTTTYWSIIMML